MDKNPFQISAVKKGSKAEIRIIGIIGWETNAEDFRKQVDTLIKEGVQDAHVYIHSPGGSCFDAGEIVNIISKFKGTVSGEGGSLVASAATYIALHCKTFSMPEKVAGWNSIVLRMLGRDVEGIIELEYDDNVEKENVYGAGGFPIGRGEGNYQAKASITLTSEEIIALQQSLGPGKRLTDIAPFDIPVRYEYNGFSYRDVIRNAEFMGNARAVKQNDKIISNKFDLLVSHIEWNMP